VGYIGLGFLAYFSGTNSASTWVAARAGVGCTQSNAYPLFRTADLFAAQRQSHFDPPAPVKTLLARPRICRHPRIRVSYTVAWTWYSRTTTRYTAESGRNTGNSYLHVRAGTESERERERERERSGGNARDSYIRAQAPKSQRYLRQVFASRNYAARAALPRIDESFMRRNRFSNRASEIRHGATDCLYALAARILNSHDDSARLLTIVNVNLALTVRGRRTNLIKPPEDFREILIEMEERGSSERAAAKSAVVAVRLATRREYTRAHARRWCVRRADSRRDG